MDHWALEDGLRVYKGRVLGNRLELEEGRESCRDTILAEREGEQTLDGDLGDERDGQTEA